MLVAHDRTLVVFVFAILHVVVVSTERPLQLVRLFALAHPATTIRSSQSTAAIPVGNLFLFIFKDAAHRDDSFYLNSI